MTDDQDILNVAQTTLQQDPTISDPNGIIPSVHKEGPLFRKKTVLKLDGTVRSAIEVDKVAQILQRKLPTLEIQNNLIAT